MLIFNIQSEFIGDILQPLSHAFQQLQSESFLPHHLSSVIHHDMEMDATESSMVHGAIVANSLGPTSDVDGDPKSDERDNNKER